MTLLAFHGWYDYSYSGEKLDKILKRKKQLWFDRRLKRLGNDPEICHNGLKRLDDILNDLDTSKLIVAMHFVPHNRFTITHERFKPFNAFWDLNNSIRFSSSTALKMLFSVMPTEVMGR